MRVDRPATIGDVAECFRRFLERELTDTTTAAVHIADQPTVWGLIDRVMGSTEAMCRRINQASGLIDALYDPSVVAIEASDEERKGLLEAAVERLGRVGRGAAYEWLFRDPRLYDDRSSRWNLEKLLEIGGEDIDAIACLFRRNGLDLPVGMTLASLGTKRACMAPAAFLRFADFVAIEIRTDDIDEGRAWLAERGARLPAMMSLAQMVADRPSCDIFHSTMTLQHIAPPAMIELLDICLAGIRPNGFAIFQVPIHLYDYRFDPAAYREMPAAVDESEVHALPQRHVFDLFEQHGMTPIEAIPDRRMGPMAFSFTYFARKRR